VKRQAPRPSFRQDAGIQRHGWQSHRLN
jgi:hypothetical protein